MDWQQRINNVVDYIEDNLTSDISYDTIAGLAACSIYNFQRMFSYISGRSLSEYVRGRRLTLAAFDLLNGSEAIVDIALKYGYESPDSFARAFRSFHGHLPSSLRKGTVQLTTCPKFTFHVTTCATSPMPFQIERWPAFSVMGRGHTVETARAFATVPTLWKDAWETGVMERLIQHFPDYRPSGFLGIAMGGEWGRSEEMTYIIGATNAVDVPGCRRVPPIDGMTEFSFPAATWIVIDAAGDLPGAVQDRYHEFYSGWLPDSGYGLADLPVFECYLQEGKQEIWIALNDGADE